MIAMGDARHLPLADDSVNCVVTSPPYWGMRDYDVDGQIGLEDSVDEYLAELVEVFRGVRRVLRPDGTLWVNMGDRFAGSRCGESSGFFQQRPNWMSRNKVDERPPAGLPRKNLMGLPWRVALALQADGWVLRCDIIWHKPTVMPETVSDRPTRAHEYVFLFAQGPKYWYDSAALRERASWKTNSRGKGVTPKSDAPGSGTKSNTSFNAALSGRNPVKTRNGRSLWSIQPDQHHGAHKATFPVELARRCIRAGCPAGGVVLDPFAGSGTTVRAAEELGRVGIGVELSPEYCREALARCGAPLQRDLLEATR